jgi:hypothetical protein
MNEEDKKIIKEIMAGMHCPKDFSCAESGFEILCKARDFGLDSYLECLEPVPQRCSFAIPFGNVYFCQCPLRVYIEKKLKK